VYLELLKNSAKQKNYTPHVERFRIWFEKHLIFANLPQTAKAFILYRRERRI
jgi:hypothetical protein